MADEDRMVTHIMHIWILVIYVHSPALHCHIDECIKAHFNVIYMNFVNIIEKKRQ